MLAAGYATVKKKKRKKSQCMASKRGIKSVLVSLRQSGRASCSSDSEACLRCRRPGCNPWVGKVLWRRAWQPRQYSCWEKSMDREAWRATVHGVVKNRTWLPDWHTEVRPHVGCIPPLVRWRVLALLLKHSLNNQNSETPIPNGLCLFPGAAGVSFPDSFHQRADGVAGVHVWFERTAKLDQVWTHGQGVHIRTPEV